MTTIDSSTSIDLEALDGVIASHLFTCRPELLGRRYALNRKLGSTASEAAFTILFEDAAAARNVGDREYCVLQALQDGFQLALDIAALVSKSPLMPNKAAINNLLAEADAKLARNLERVGLGDRELAKAHGDE